MPTTKTTAGKVTHTIEEVVLPNQLFTRKELIGKTIKKVKKFYGSDGDAFVFFFTDETFAIFDPKIEVDYGDVREAVIKLTHVPSHCWLKEFGLIQEEEFNKIEEKVKAHYKKEERQRKRVLYNKLKKEFGDE